MKSINIVFPEKERVEVREEAVREPASGEVLCAAEKSLISTGTEIQCLRGLFDPGTNWADWIHYPFYPGYSMAARVIGVGKGVAGIREGDRIAADAPHCRFFTVEADKICLLPESAGYEDGAFLSLACTTQLGVRRAALALGETVGVVGLGLLGQLVVQYLRLSGAKTIIAIDTVPGRLELAMSLGATHMLQTDIGNAREKVCEITGGKMADVVFDITGHPSVLPHALQLLRKMGRLVLLGDTATPSRQYMGPGVVSNSLSILGIHASMFPEKGSEFNPWSYEEMAALFFEYIRQGRMNVGKLISHRISPREAPEAYRELTVNRPAYMGVIFDWGLI